MKRLTLLISLLVALSTQARDLRLAQALQLAEQHSFALQKARSNSAAALADLSGARADRLPTLSLTGAAFYVNEIPTMTISAGPVSVTRDVGTDQTYQTDLRLSVPLFTGGRISGNINIASATAAYYAASEIADRDRTAMQTRFEYFNLERADRQLAAARAALERTHSIDQDVHSLYQAGMADSVNILDASLAVTKATFGVTQAETNRRAVEIRLSYLVGLPVSEPITLIDSLPVPTQEVQPTGVAPTKPELMAADAGIKSYQSKLRITKADYFPSLTAYTGYSYGKPNLDRFNNTWNDYFTVGGNLSWSFNVGNKTGRKARAARYYLEAAQNDRKQLEENLSRDAAVYFEQLKLAQARYQSSLNELTISKANYELAKAQHRDGVLGSNRLVQIEADLAASEATLAASLADYYIAQSSYYYAIGSENLRKGL